MEFLGNHTFRKCRPTSVFLLVDGSVTCAGYRQRLTRRRCVSFKNPTTSVHKSAGVENQRHRTLGEKKKARMFVNPNQQSLNMLCFLKSDYKRKEVETAQTCETCDRTANSMSGLVPPPPPKLHVSLLSLRRSHRSRHSGRARGWKEGLVPRRAVTPANAASWRQEPASASGGGIPGLEQEWDTQNI